LGSIHPKTVHIIESLAIPLGFFCQDALDLTLT
jgi:hypothetical protein